MEREKGFERFLRRVNNLKQDAPLPFTAAKPVEFPVPSRSTWSRPVPALGAAAGHMWGTYGTRGLPAPRTVHRPSATVGPAASTREWHRRAPWEAATERGTPSKRL